MTLPQGRPIGISLNPKADGTQMLKVDVDGVGECEIAFSEPETVHFVRVFQQGFLKRYLEIGSTPEYPELHIQSVSLAHGKEQSSLLVDTVHTGSFAMLASLDTFKKMRSELSRLIGIMEAPKH